MTTTNWRASAACHTEDPDLFFPQGNTGPWLARIEEAKTVCRSCPVITQCLQYALDTNPADGIFAGLTTAERASVRRSARRRKLAPDKVTARAEAARSPQRPRALPAIVEASTGRDADGHLIWVGSPSVHFGGRVYTPKQAAYIADRGHEPDGRVVSGCGVTECVLARHLTDHAERTRWRSANPGLKRKPARCGTNSGYSKHQREKTEVCGPCRQAHADADARLRRTGTTKELAA